MTDSIFSLILLCLVLASGLITLLDIFWLKTQSGKAPDSGLQAQEEKKGGKRKKSGWIETIRSIFPVLLVVFLIRSFLYAPFKIPSGSMIPTLEIGDHILVSKFAYGLRFPYFGNKIIAIGKPKRGDVVVFSSTPEFTRQNSGKKEDLIKRLVGLPGDHIRYEGKNLYINGKLVSKHFVATHKGEYEEVMGGVHSYNVYSETLGSHTFQVQNYPDAIAPTGEWTVPPHMYFMMGDNRDLSDDSRYWGFVPENHLIGKAVVVWMHWPSWGSLPSFKHSRVIR